MFLKITKVENKKGVKKYAKIAESYRTNGKTRSKILFNLGAINCKQDLERYKQILRDLQNEEEFIKIKDISLLNSKQFGVTYTTDKLLEKYGLDEVLKKSLSKNKAKFDVFSTVKALIINRLIKPSSELSAYDWIKKDYSEDLNVKQQDLYRSLDYLIDEKDNIEKGIFEALKTNMDLDTSIVRYDLTSSYLEGKKCEIALYGYSRDHRQDRKQIVIGVVMCDGLPIYHEVYEGNTVDKSTLKSMINNLKEKLGIKEPIFVGDRGLITEQNLEGLENEDYDYILGVQRRNNNIAKECLTKEIYSNKQTAKEVKKETVKEEDKSPRRYILCLDNKTRQERLKTLDEIKTKAERKLMELQKKKISEKEIIKKVSDVLGNNLRLFNITSNKEGFSFSLNKENWEYERKIAGKFLLVTNTDLTPVEVMKEYKKQQQVENAFDEIKNFLKIRPIQHSSEKRVRAHVFICVLSYLIESIIEKFSDESGRRTIEKLGRIKVGKLNIGDKKSVKISKEDVDSALKIFNKLRIKKPERLDL